MSAGLKANADGSAAIQVGGSDAITITSGLAATFPSNVFVTGNALLTGATSTLGYGTGSGGTVTQLTNKATAVTLNTPSGRIIMAATALAANTTVEFTLNNSLIAGNDMIVLNITGNVATAAAYNIGTRSVAGGSIVVGIRNVTAGSLSEAIQITFALIKGVTS